MYENILTLRNESRAASKLWRDIELRSELVHNTYRDYALSRGDAWDMVGPEANRLKKWYLAQDFAVDALKSAIEAGDAFKKGRVTYREEVIDLMNGFAADHLAAYNALLERGIDVFGNDYQGIEERLNSDPELSPLIDAERAAKDKIYHFEHSFWESWFEHQKQIVIAFAAESIHPTVRYGMDAEREQYEYDAGHGWYDEEESPYEEKARFDLNDAIFAAASMKPDADKRLAVMTIPELADEYLAIRHVLDLLREYLSGFHILTDCQHSTMVATNKALAAVEYHLFKRDHAAYYAWYLEQKRAYNETGVQPKYHWVYAAITKDNYDDDNEEGEW